MQQIYDQVNPKSIEEHGKKLVGKTLRLVEGVKPEESFLLDKVVGVKGRASFGEAVEKYYYGIYPGNASEPDFVKAGVELKTSPVKKLGNGSYSAKERLVLGMIDYLTEGAKTFESSSFMAKNAHLMLISYLHEQGVKVGDLKVMLAKLIEYGGLPEEDRIIIRQDWETIIKKIRDNKAHELSEGDTLYLGACTKSADSSKTRAQVGGVAAKPRAYSLKSGYMTLLTRRLLGKVDVDETYVADVNVLKHKTFEELVLEKFKKFEGKTVSEIHEMVGDGLSLDNKAYLANLARRMIGVKTKKIAEFEAANVLMKTIQLKKGGTPKESMSFPYFKYKELVEEKWDGDEESGEVRSSFQKDLERKFLFIVYQCDGDCKKGDCKRFVKAVFWTMPNEDLTEARRVWEETVKRVKEGNADSLPGAKESLVAHTRPHGKNKHDTDETPDGKQITKKCFWFNSGYLSKIINLYK